MEQEKKKLRLSLYRLNQELQAIDTELEENGGDYDEVIAQRMDALGLQAGDIVDGLQQLVAMNQASDDALATEIKRLQALKKSRGNKVEALKRYLFNTMVGRGDNIWEGQYATAKITAGRESVQVDEEALLAHYAATLDEMQAMCPKFIKVKFEVSKTAIAEELKAGGLVPSATIVKNPTLKIS